MTRDPDVQPTPATDRDTDKEWRPPTGNGLRELGIAFVQACVIMAPILGVGGWMTYTDWREGEDARLAAIEAAQAHERLVAAPPGAMLALAEAVRGRELFSTTCVACHGPEGKGVEGLGKSLVESDFVALQSDEELRRFIVTGRPDARPVAMPPMAGRDDLTEEELRHLVVFVRGLQDPRRLPELPAMVIDSRPSEAQAAAALAVAGGDEELAGYIASGDKLFHSMCIACHGKGGVGIAGNGKALARNEFVASQDDDALLAFIKQGRAPSDPKNTTGVQMPPKGGNPAMSEDDILDVISYLRTLQGGTPGAAPSN